MHRLTSIPTAALLLLLALPGRAQDGPPPGPDAGSSETNDSPFGVIGAIRPQEATDSFGFAVSGRSTLPPGTSLRLAMRFHGYELSQYWTQCSVDSAGGFVFQVGPLPRRCVHGTYLFDVSFDPTSQGRMNPFPGESLIRHVTASLRVGTVEDEAKDRAECRTHFRKTVDAFEVLLKELQDTSEAMRASKRFVTRDSPPQFDPAAFATWAEDFWGRVSACRREHEAFVVALFAHFFPVETRFAVPGLFSDLEMACFHELTPGCRALKVASPSWLSEVERRCEGVPLLPPLEAVLRTIHRDLRTIREETGLVPVAFSLREVALTRLQFEDLKKSEQGGPLRAFEWGSAPAGAAAVSTEIPHLFQMADLPALRDLPSWTYPEIPTASVTGLYYAVMVESPMSPDAKAAPARLTVIGIEYASVDIARQERDRAEAALDQTSSRLACAIRRNRVVVVVAFEGRGDRLAAWRFLTLWFTQHME